MLKRESNQCVPHLKFHQLSTNWISPVKRDIHPFACFLHIRVHFHHPQPVVFSQMCVKSKLPKKCLPPPGSIQGDAPGMEYQRWSPLGSLFPLHIFLLLAVTKFQKQSPLLSNTSEGTLSLCVLVDVWVWVSGWGTLNVRVSIKRSYLYV